MIYHNGPQMKIGSETILLFPMIPANASLDLNYLEGKKLPYGTDANLVSKYSKGKSK